LKDVYGFYTPEQAVSGETAGELADNTTKYTNATVRIIRLGSKKGHSATYK
jgi:hypothetical protein